MHVILKSSQKLSIVEDIHNIYFSFNFDMFVAYFLRMDCLIIWGFRVMEFNATFNYISMAASFIGGRNQSILRKPRPANPLAQSPGQVKLESDK
jgi:hypothetical protein